MELRVCLGIKISGQILGGRVDYFERFEIVDHLVIETIDHMSHYFAKIFEIEQKAGFVELFSGEGDPNFVVVSMRVLALAFVIAQVVPRGKRIFYGDFEHRILGLTIPNSIVRDRNGSTSRSGRDHCCMPKKFSTCLMSVVLR